jgi:CRP/FNR family cyclic AMP-dependent transcriptional regulator
LKPSLLSQKPLFRGVPTPELERFTPLMHQRTFPAGSTVITAEQPGEAVYVLLRGSVKVHLLTPEGTEVILAVLGPGEVVGEMSLADSLGRSASVKTLEETTLLCMDRVTFRTSVEEAPALARNLAKLLSRRLKLANTHVRSLAALDVLGRVAAQLLALAKEYGEPSPGDCTLIPLPLTQSDLAALVGASRVRVNQAIAFFKRRGWISVGRTTASRSTTRTPSPAGPGEKRPTDATVFGSAGTKVARR